MEMKGMCGRCRGLHAHLVQYVELRTSPPFCMLPVQDDAQKTCIAKFEERRML